MNTLDVLFARLKSNANTQSLCIVNRYLNHIIEDTRTGKTKFLFEPESSHPFPTPDSPSFETLNDDYMDHILSAGQAQIFARTWFVEALETFRASYSIEPHFLKSGCCSLIELIPVHISEIAEDTCYKLPTHSEARGLV